MSTEEISTDTGLIPAYMEVFRSGRYESPSPDVIAKWLEHFDIPVIEFLKITGVDRSRYNRIIRGDSKKGLDYAETRLFLISAGLVEPEIIKGTVDELDKRLQHFMRDHNIGISEFTTTYMNMSHQWYYNLRKTNREALREKLKEVLDKIA